MAAKIVAKIILTGTQIVGRAFMDAYRQAAAQGAAKQGASNIHGATGAASTASKSAASAAVNELTRKTGLSLEEAAQILNVPVGAPMEAVEKSFAHLHKANYKATGGSFYLQSKVYRARERFALERGGEEGGTLSAAPAPKEK